MLEGMAVLLHDDVDGRGRDRFDGRCVIHVDLGEGGAYRIAVKPGKARLSDVAAVAQELASKMSCEILRSTESRGEKVSCCKGCGACCQYLVPLSMPEAFRLVEDINSLSKPRRKKILSAFKSAARRVIKATPAQLKSDSAETIGRWYSQLKLPCPFLSDNVCTFYQYRPIACREHMVTSDPRFCVGFQPNAGKVVPMAVSILDAMGQLAAELEGTETEAVMMPLAVEWANLNAQRNQRTWPAEQLFQRFANILNQQSAANAPKSAVA